MSLDSNAALLPCPFCGEAPVFPPAFEVFGSCYDGGCTDCGIAEISLQITDCFDYPRDHVHRSYDNTKHQYGIEFIEVARNQAIEMWNARAHQQDSLPVEAIKCAIRALDVVVEETLFLGTKKELQAHIESLRALLSSPLHPNP